MFFKLANITGNDLGLGNNPITLDRAPQAILTVLFEIAGGVAVVFIIIGGIQYVVSAGDSKRVESAKNTILNAVIGLAIAVFAGVIVNFLLNHL